MRTIKVIVLALVAVHLGLGLLAPALAQVVSQLVPENCDFNTCDKEQFFILLKNIINFFVFYLSVPIATIAIAYAGMTMAFNPGKEGTRTEGKQIIEAAVIGLVLVLGAWLIVTTILGYLLDSETASSIRPYISP